jgi:predicted TIM-barrel fold metal-dependent hydrolase
MNFIDAHSHVWTPDTKAYPLAAGFRRFDMNPPSFTVEELQAQMQSVGVNRAVLIQMSFYGFDNSYLLDSIRRFPGQFRGVAVIDQNAQEPAAQMRALKPLGIRGFRIYPKNEPIDNWLGSESMHHMFAAGAALRMAMCCLIDPDALPSLDRMCRDFPETPVVIDHLCRIGVSGAIQEQDVEALCRMARHKHVNVKVSAFYALGKKQSPYRDLGPLIKRVYEAFGPERLMWASDSPFQVVGGHQYRASIDLVKTGLDFLSAADKEWLLRKTAERVFFAA